MTLPRLTTVTMMRSVPAMDGSSLVSRRRFLRQTAAGLALGVTLPRIASAEVKLAARITAETSAEHVLSPAFRLALKGLEALAKVNDYEATFIRKELVGASLVESRMNIKLRHDPFSVYLKFIEPKAGREVIFVEGQNDGKLLVHESGLASLVGTLSLDPSGKLAMDGNRYPVTMIGLRKMVETLVETWLKVKDEKDLAVNVYPNASIGDVQCKVVETKLAKPVEGMPWQTARLYLTRGSTTPVRLESLGFPESGSEQGATIEDYYYSKLKLNVGLTDADFDVKNPAYGF
jgi:hypothetical protein